jgi:hypothetical protein
MSEIKQEFVVPMEATERGSLIVGELKSESAVFPSMLAQFSKIDPSSRKAKIYLYPTLDQAKQLFAMPPPFNFHGEYDSTADVREVWTADGIWLKSGSEIGGTNRKFWSSPAGNVESLVISAVSSGGLFNAAASSAWFAANRCFLFQILANPEDEDMDQAKKFGFEREKFFLEVSDGGTAEIQHYIRSRRIGVLKDLKKKGYSIHVRNYKDVDAVRKDSEALMILASLGSREQTMFWHWSSSSGMGEMTRRWRFNAKKFARRDPHTDPLLPRDRAACIRFLQTAFPIYRGAMHTELFDGAVYALMARELVLEVRIARLFFGIQGALVFALQEPRGKKRAQVRSLYERFLAKYGGHFDDLWPLLHNPQGGPSLSDLRNAVAHGEAFTEDDFLALSYASQNLEWMLERILLLSLGWKIDESYVSLRTLQRFCAHQWRAVQQNLKI